MGDYLPPGSCDAQLKALNQASKDLNKAFTGYQSAKHNMQAGGVSTAGAGVGALACTLATAGLGAVLCLGGAGLATIGGILWTESAAEGLGNATDDLESAVDRMDEAIDKLCTCINQHMLSVPD